MACRVHIKQRPRQALSERHCAAGRLTPPRVNALKTTHARKRNRTSRHGRPFDATTRNVAPNETLPWDMQSSNRSRPCGHEARHQRIVSTMTRQSSEIAVAQTGARQPHAHPVHAPEAPRQDAPRMGAAKRLANWSMPTTSAAQAAAGNCHHAS